jgi:large subunit ribosomal protein L10
MDLAQKKTLVENLAGKVSESVIVIIAEYSGITVSQINELRTKAREADISVKVCKNSLFTRVLEGSSFGNLKDKLSGPNMFVMSGDPVSAAKLVANFASDNELFKVKGGSFNGDLLDRDSIVALSKMPSLDELRARIISIINTPATNIARIVKEPLAKVVRVINAHSKQ